MQLLQSPSQRQMPGIRPFGGIKPFRAKRAQLHGVNHRTPKPNHNPHPKQNVTQPHGRRLLLCAPPPPPTLHPRPQPLAPAAVPPPQKTEDALIKPAEVAVAALFAFLASPSSSYMTHTHTQRERTGLPRPSAASVPRRGQGGGAGPPGVECTAMGAWQPPSSSCIKARSAWHRSVCARRGGKQIPP